MSSGFGIAQLKEMREYHRALSSFFQVTGIKQNISERALSARAQKARAKLLKLSESQFYELSTDVYDELNRRIREGGEGASGTNSSVPNTNRPEFHVKRNQARQKLANLSQSRFNDLVDDILFEMDRRRVPLGSRDSQHETDQSQPMNTENRDADHDANTSIAQEASASSVQALLIIPKKASIDWSDEEDENGDTDQQRKLPALDTSFAQQPPALSGDYNSGSSPIISTYHDGDSTPNKENGTSTDQLVSTSDKPSLHQIITIDDQGHQEEKVMSPVLHHNFLAFNDSSHQLIDSNHEQLLDELIVNQRSGNLSDNNQRPGPLDQNNAKVDQVTSSMHSHPDNELNGEVENVSTDRDNRSDKELLINTASELADTKAVLEQVVNENALLKEQVAELKVQPRRHDWGSVRSHSIPLAEKIKNITSLDRYKDFFSSKGMRCSQKIVNINETASLLLEQLTKFQDDVQDGKDVNDVDSDVKLIFELTSQLSSDITDITGDISNGNHYVKSTEESKNEALIKSSVSHFITAVRYFVAYGPLLVPALVVHSSIMDIFIALATVSDQLKENGTNSGRPNSIGAPVASDITELATESRRLDSTPGVDVFRFTENINTDNFEDPQRSMKFDMDREEASPVKPLKITQKALNSPNLRSMAPPPAFSDRSRKASGTGLLSLVKDSRSSLNVPVVTSETTPIASHNGKPLSPDDEVDYSMDFESKKLSEKPVINSSTPTKAVSEELDNMPAELSALEEVGKRVNSNAQNVMSITEAEAQERQDGGYVHGVMDRSTSTILQPKPELQQIAQNEINGPVDDVISASSPRSHKEMERRLSDGIRNLASPVFKERRSFEQQNHDATKSRELAEKLRLSLNSSSSEEDGDSANYDLSDEETTYLQLKKNMKKADDDGDDLQSTHDHLDDESGNSKPLSMEIKKITHSKHRVEYSSLRKTDLSSKLSSVDHQNTQINAQVSSGNLLHDNKILPDITHGSSSDGVNENFKDDLSSDLDYKSNHHLSVSKHDENLNHDFQKAVTTPNSNEKGNALGEPDNIITEESLKLTKEKVETPSSDAGDIDVQKGEDNSVVKHAATISAEPGSKANKIHNETQDRGSQSQLRSQSTVDSNSVPPLLKNDTPDYLAKSMDENKNLHAPDDVNTATSNPSVDVGSESAHSHESNNDNENNDQLDDTPSSETLEPDFNVEAFDIENPDNTLSELLLYLEHQTMEVISTIQSLLTSIKKPDATKGNLRIESNAINQVIWQMANATSISMNQTRNSNLKKHGSWVVQSLEDCARRMTTLCDLSSDGNIVEHSSDTEYADKNFKQRLAGIAFDVAKCTKELVKTVEEASLKEEIEYLNSKLDK